ncbi:choice-of-anchor O protein [Desulforhopalus sp. IMCC35007]|uniref:choice-of-anchor O protein n=1 Tax=Desulforhopalus sp. IMCC35007 TaxID=2569543 RepID=UPI0010ADDB19|nr:choice-of-anchor O protein [Desulforhopalus sp. IMCC35007]TKB08201.1 hypothetical protein FCL48_14595 [Desulforhopalus sp. IMCC35007]
MRKLLFWFFIFVFGGSFLAEMAMAAWVPSEDDAITVAVSSGVIDSATETVTFTVAVTNGSEADLEGNMRVYIQLDDGVAGPINTTGTTDDGSLYYDFATAADDLFAVDETVSMDVVFAAGEINDINVPPFQPVLNINDASLSNTIFRKIISKTPEFYSGEAKISVVPRYTQARNTKDELLYKDPESGSFISCPVASDGTADCPIDTKVKPIVVTYLQELEGTEFNSVPDYDADGDGIKDGWRLAHDVYTAVSLDEGATWKRKNISKTAVKSSFELPNEVKYPGDSEVADMAVAGENILVTWVDKYCRSGNPWGIEDEDDDYQIMGSQRSVDYEDVKGDEEPRPDLGVRPFSCVWAARGVLQLNQFYDDEESVPNPDFGTVVWYSAEQITTGRRDAIRVFPAAEDPDTKGPGGFAITWQEDPKGLKTGKGRGPGAGMSGAGVNHKTDIWYTYLEFENFAEIDEGFVPNEDADRIFLSPEVNEDFAADDTRATPHVDVTFSPPVRITDNAVCKERVTTDIVAHVHDPADTTTCDYYYEGGTNNEPILWEDLPEEWTCPKCGLPKDSFLEVPEVVGTRNEGAPYCAEFANNPRVDGDGEEVTSEDPAFEIAYYTSDEGVPLDGNTGASRANLSLVNWMGETLALVAYEETKGIGVGGDKEAAAMEQAAAFPLVHYIPETTYDTTSMQDGVETTGTLLASPYAVYKNEDGTVDEYHGDAGYLGGFTNRDCRSCHYDNIVPKNRFIPVGDRNVCISDKGGTWLSNAEAYFPYSGYPLATEQPVALLPDSVDLNTSTGLLGGCVKFIRGTAIYPRDYAQTDPDALYVLPEHLPGWHSKNIDCSSCHVAYNTKDTDMDTAPDRSDLCLGTPLLEELEEGETIDLVIGSPTYGCATTQTVGDPDNNKDAEPRYRHGKNIYYHSFALDNPDTIAHGAQINIPNMDWTAPGTLDGHDENARRVRVVPNPRYGVDGANITLGLLYKQGKDGQGAPADAFIRFFRNGFDATDNLDTYAMNLSSSTPYIFKEEELEPGEVDYSAADGTGDLLSGHQTPNVEHFYWTTDNLDDSSGYWNIEDGEKLWVSDGADGEIPDLVDNPFDNVFSTRLEIRGNFVAVGFAYSTNWAAAKKAKDHYDFYVRTSDDGGVTWTLPVNVSELKNHEESVSDCRLLLPPDTLYPPGATYADYMLPPYDGIEIPLHDYFNENSFFVALGTKENTPQPAPNVTELEEDEIFLDLSYSRATRDEDDGLFYYEGIEKENPKYVSGSMEYIDNITGEPTNNAVDEFEIANEINPAYDEFIVEFDWIAKGDAFQGDIQVVTDPSASALHSIWEQELAIDEESSMSHFQGADVWYRKVKYPQPIMGDTDSNGIIDMTDIYGLMSYRNQYSDKCPECDIDGDKIITVLDARKLMMMCTYPRCASQ